MYNYKIVNKIGKMENNNINNSIITTIMNENGIKVSSIYNQNIYIQVSTTVYHLHKYHHF